MIEYVLVSSPVLLLFLVILLPKKVRPERVIVEYDIRHNPVAAFSTEDITEAIQAFDSVWFGAYPDHKKAFIKAARDLDIKWVNKKITEKEELVIARMNSLHEIEIWIGPKLPGGKREIAYTGLLDQLIKLTMLVNNIVPNTNTPTVHTLIEDMKSRIR